MTHVVYRIPLLIAFALTAASADAATRVYLLGGQSNMVGAGVATSISATYETATTRGVNYWNGSTWVALKAGLGSGDTMGGTLTSFGPEVSFGYTIQNAYPTDTIYLVKYAVAGTNLAGDWNPNGTGAKYNGFKATVNAALANLTNAHIPYTVAGMLWMQGESDTSNSTNAANYAAILTNLISKVRSDFSASAMRFAIGRITTYFGTTANNTLVRNAQQTVGNTVPNAISFGTDDLTWAFDGHYGTDGQVQLGIRFADAMATPEPGTLAMLASIALLGLGYAYRKRKS